MMLCFHFQLYDVHQASRQDRARQSKAKQTSTVERQFHYFILSEKKATSEIACDMANRNEPVEAAAAKLINQNATNDHL